MKELAKNRIMLLVIGVALILVLFYQYKNLQTGEEKINHKSIFVLGEHELPVINILTDPVEIWSQESGIYSMGKNIEKEYPYYGANFWEDKKVESVFEYIVDGSVKVESECRVWITGGKSRALPQKSLAIEFMKDGDSETINYDFFDSNKDKKFKSLILRNAGQDFEKSHIRDGFSSILAKQTKVDYQRYKPVVVYLAGEHVGVYDLKEKIDEDYIKNIHGTKKIDLIENGEKDEKGNLEKYDELIDEMKEFEKDPKKTIDYIYENIDIENFTDYFILETYIANTDWPFNNVRCWREKDDYKRWKWIIYDCDRAFEDYEYNAFEELEVHFSGRKKSPARIFEILISDKEYRNYFEKRVYELLKSSLSYENSSVKLKELISEIKFDMNKHLIKWGMKEEMWQEEIEKIDDFLEKREEVYVKQMKDYFEKQ